MPAKQPERREPVILRQPGWEYYRDLAEFSQGYLPLAVQPARKPVSWYGFAYFHGTSSLRARMNQNLVAKAILRHISGVNL